MKTHKNVSVNKGKKWADAAARGGGEFYSLSPLRERPSLPWDELKEQDNDHQCDHHEENSLEQDTSGVCACQ